jgi:FixJ family two-component response regulator
MISDVIMPGMSASELSTQLSCFRPAMAILFMSGYTEETIASQGVLASQVSFLEKPFTANSLLRRVREALDHG